jgi:hypothetical protein
MTEDTERRTSWYDSKWGRRFYWGILVGTVLAVVASAFVSGLQFRVPAAVYLFGFLGATVYVFTSFAKQFGAAGRYRLKILSRTVAVLPLAAGVYLLALAFPGIEGDLSVLAASTGNQSATQTDRLVAGLVFLAGIYVNTTLKALGRLAERLLGVGPSGQNGESARGEPESASATSGNGASGESTSDADASGTDTDTQSEKSEATDTQPDDER